MTVGRTKDQNVWFAHQKANPGALVRLFGFPYAGGNASIYRRWQQDLPEWAEVWPVQLPGHGNRLHESPCTDLDALVEMLRGALLPLLDKPFAFFGHSMGAVIAFELARALRRSQLPGPFHLFVSGRRAPQLPAEDATYNLPEQEFMEELRRLNGTPKEVLENDELMRLMVPVLRADFELVQTYTYRPEPPLDCPITAFGGWEDHNVSRESLESWREQTAAGFSVKMLLGDHFFLQSAQPYVLRAVARELQAHVCP